MGSKTGREITLYRVGFVLLLSAAALTRSHTLDTHFTHIDDIGVAKTILDARTPGYLERRLADRTSPTYDDPVKRALRLLTGDRGLPLLDWVMPWVVIPAS